MFRQKTMLPVLLAGICAVAVVRCGAVDDGQQAPRVRGKADGTFDEKIVDCKSKIMTARSLRDKDVYVDAVAEAEECLAEAREWAVIGTRITEGLAQARDQYQAYDIDVNQVVPTDKQAEALVESLPKLTHQICDASGLTGKKGARCQALAEGLAPYVLANWIVPIDDYVSWRKWLAEALPQSERIAGCQKALDEAMEQGSSQMEMNMAQSEFVDCVTAKNNELLDTQFSQDKNPRANTMIKALRSALGDLCDLMVNISDSPTGSISTLYGLGCLSDTEGYLASAIDMLTSA